MFLKLRCFVGIPREDRVISLKNSYIEINFEVFHYTPHDDYEDADLIRIFNLGPYALFSK